LKGNGDYAIRSIERAVSVLEVLARAEHPTSLSRIAGAAQLSVPTTFRILRTLQGQNLVTWHAEAGEYGLGLRVLELAQGLLRQLDVVGITRPYLRAVRNELDETTALMVRSEDEWVCVAQAEAAQPLRSVIQVGDRLPLYAGSAGKLFLADLSETELEEYIARTEFVSFSDTTPTDPIELRRQIEYARLNGYAAGVNQRGAGGAGVSAPIFGHDGRLVAAFSVSGPMTRYTPEASQRWCEAVLASARDISRALGARSV
jgi:DNA-binding IclR family transcriptional regulator